jgi:uncharacterized membrane protein YecN with MAPEG domain
MHLAQHFATPSWPTAPPGATIARMPVPITALYGALNAILNILLAARISPARGKYGVSMGTGDSKELLAMVRAHGNNAEFMPLGVLMILIAELGGGSNLWLHVLGGSLLLSRILHAIGMPMRAPNPFRFVGTAGTWTVILGASVYCLVLRARG